MGQGFAQVAFGDHQRLSDMTVMLPAQAAGWTQTERIGEQLQWRAFAEAQEARQIRVANRQHRTQRHDGTVVVAYFQQSGAHQWAVMRQAGLDLRQRQAQ
ncbi:hypothetical protein D3C81_1697470 [compost metagenome]